MVHRRIPPDAVGYPHRIPWDLIRCNSFYCRKEAEEGEQNRPALYVEEAVESVGLNRVHYNLG